MILRIAVPTPLRRLFDYLPGKFELGTLMPGMRVKVPFSGKQLVGVVIEKAEQSDLPTTKLKTISAVLDDTPLLPSNLLNLLDWAASYYQYPLGEALQTALPSILRQAKPASIEDKISWALTPAGQAATVDDFKRAPKQWQTLQLLQQHITQHTELDAISDAELATVGIERTFLKILKSKELVFSKKANKINKIMKLKKQGPVLNAEQAKAVMSILAVQNQYQSFLLDGVTGSGKTEVYLSVLEKIITSGGQALVLVPEIGLTPQTVQRFRERLNCPIVLLHSGLSDKQRLENWLLAKNGDISVIIGTRSAVFAPFKSLKCIVVDEAHDHSYKQWDGFKYHARDLAVRRAQLEKIPVVLGTATPSLSSLHNVEKGKFSYCSLTERATGASLPRFHILDVRNKPLQQGFAKVLFKQIEHELKHGNQVLVFINRRGFAPVTLCHDCGWLAECERCHAPMTKHQSPANLQCHHCGKQRRCFKHCPECNSEQLLDVGLGTERVEQVLQKQFPKVHIARIDRDSTRKKGAFADKLAAIHSGHAQILIGTQMLAKGHHFPNVTLVVMLGVDGGLYSADFNASEQMAQLLLQVAGRAGREEKPGQVILQTHHPEHPLLQTLLAKGYAAFAKQLLQERQQARLSPYYYFALFRAEAVDGNYCQTFLEVVKQLLIDTQMTLELPEFELFGPIIAPIEKRAGRYRWQLILSCVQRKYLHRLLKSALPSVEKLPEARKVRWSLDIDPINML